MYPKRIDWSQIRTNIANSAEPDQTPHSTVSDKVLYSSVCLQNVILQFERNGKLLPNKVSKDEKIRNRYNQVPHLCFRYGFFQLIRAKNSITHKCANWPQIN